MNLRDFYDARVASIPPENFLQQVGHTVSGSPISQNELSKLQESIVSLLDLKANDQILELCCGNGLMTKFLSDRATFIYGIDLSENMIQIAKTYNSCQNIVYQAGDVRHLTFEQDFSTDFNKILMFAALQHFETADFEKIIQSILSKFPDIERIALGFIPNKKYRWRFYQGFYKKLVYLGRIASRRDVMGKWWHQPEIEKVSARNGLNARFFEIAPGDYGHPFRFHAVLTKRQDNLA